MHNFLLNERLSNGWVKDSPGITVEGDWRQGLANNVPIVGRPLSAAPSEFRDDLAERLVAKGLRRPARSTYTNL
eukprot:608470-Amorphochlora_amoeboformis.AAC.1